MCSLGRSPIHGIDVYKRQEYGGSLENRMRFMDMVMKEVMKAAGSDMAVFVNVLWRWASLKVKRLKCC